MNNTNETVIKSKEVTANRAFLSYIWTRLGFFARCFIIASVAAITVSITALIIKLSVGLIISGAIFILLGAVAAFNTEKFKAMPDERIDRSHKLTKTGTIVLVISLILGIFALTLGIFMCVNVNEEEPIYTYDFANPENTFTPGANEFCTVKVSPEIAGIYTVKIKGATLDGITNSRGNKIYPTPSADGGDESYSVFLIINTDYLFRIHSTDAEFSIEFEKSN